MPENVDDAKGRVKEAAGDLTDDQSLKNEGKVDQATGTVKEKVGDAADKVKDVVNPKATDRARVRVADGTAPAGAPFSVLARVRVEVGSASATSAASAPTRPPAAAPPAGRSARRRTGGRARSRRPRERDRNRIGSIASPRATPTTIVIAPAARARGRMDSGPAGRRRVRLRGLARVRRMPRLSAGRVDPLHDDPAGAVGAERDSVTDLEPASANGRCGRSSGACRGDRLAGAAELALASAGRRVRVGEAGFEPPKAEPDGLQPPSFDRLDTPPAGAHDSRRRCAGRRRRAVSTDGRRRSRTPSTWGRRGRQLLRPRPLRRDEPAPAVADEDEQIVDPVGSNRLSCRSNSDCRRWSRPYRPAHASSRRREP